MVELGEAEHYSLSVGGLVKGSVGVGVWVYGWLGGLRLELEFTNIASLCAAAVCFCYTAVIKCLRRVHRRASGPRRRT